MQRISLALIALGASLATPIAAFAQPDPGFSHGDMHYDDRDGRPFRIYGRIAETHGGSLRLENGRTVFLHEHTTIDPVGRRLRPGERIEIRGFDAGNGAINAREIDVLPRDDDRDRDHDDDRDGYHN
jgi:hypothetical protein